jgi:hypothetical protein
VLEQRHRSCGAHQHRPRSAEFDLGGYNVQERGRLPLPTVSILSPTNTQYIQLTILAASLPSSSLSSLSSFSRLSPVGMRSATLAPAPTLTSSLSRHDPSRKSLSRSSSLPRSSFSYRSCGNIQHRWLQHRSLKTLETAV